jgi:hypothetical protein
MSGLGLSAPFSGGAQTGFTSPTYDWVVDEAPEGSSGNQVVVDTIGGTQSGVDAHSVSRPFTISVFRPKTFRSLPQVNPVTGQLPSVPRNVYKVITRKGVTPLSGQASVPLLVETIIHVPAGADEADPTNVQAALSAHVGALADISASVGDMTLSGVLPTD